ncbi:DUF3039 domain-containing protein [Leucobacter allii]|uniref:DUF3039 domain-containing protein n=1 Tax=Leucobacter allii TaxID=2932247 RepID=UPI001FD267A7|nr:DUF3039 domain-containing protein [Leucobacter allii]UOR02030.1 DUF3039 domain-containing protein [Leucobacter allii]
MSTDILERTSTTPTTTDGDHDRFAHFFKKSDLDRAYFDGAEITALCGKKDVPTRDFTRYPVCKTCQEAINAIPE